MTAGAGRRAVLVVAGATVALVWVIALWFRIVRPRPGPLDVWWDALAGVGGASPVHAVAVAFAVVGAGIPAVVVAVVVAVLLGALRGGSWCIFTLVASGISELDVLGMKALAMRLTPDPRDQVAAAFPSGHTANAALVGVVVIMLVRHLAVRIPVAAYVVAMAWSRTALHAHWLTDVLAGLAVGAASAVLLHACWSTLLVRAAARRDRLRQRAV